MIPEAKHVLRVIAKSLVISLLILALAYEASARFDSMVDYENFKQGSYGKVNDCSVTSILASIMTDPTKIFLALINPARLAPSGSSTSSNVCSSANVQNQDYFVIDTSELDNTILPTMISSKYTTTYTSGASEYNAHKATFQATVLALSFSGAFSGAASFAMVMTVLGVEFLKLIDLCSNFYVVQPYEYVARNLSSSCTSQTIQCAGSTSTTITPNGGSTCYWPPQTDCTGFYAYPPPNSINAPTPFTVPYFYTCDPTWDIDYNNGNGGQIPLGSQDDWMIGKARGYMGINSEYCTSVRSNYAQQNLIGKAVLEGYPGWYQVGCALGGWVDSSLCTSPFSTQARLTRPLTGGDEVTVTAGIATARLIGFYRTPSNTENSGGTNLYASDMSCSSANTTTTTTTAPTPPTSVQIGSGIRLCVASVDTLIPVLIGCSPVAPPGEDSLSTPYNALISGTRCEYITASVEPARSDLIALSKSLGSAPSSSSASVGIPVNQKAVQRFLASEFHFTSTVVGCLQDLLTRIFVPSGNNGTTVFQHVQDNFSQIVLAALTLYLCVTAIKVLIEGRVPKQGEIAIYILKFAIVYFFALGNVWYSPVEGGAGQGLYPALLELSDQITGWMIQMSNKYDIRGYCNYTFQGANIFSDRLITNLPGVSAQDFTIGFPGIQMTFWDLIDCKMANYWNLGSCDYTLGGIIVSWMFCATLLLSMNGAFFFGVAAIIYFVISFSILVRYVHIFILSMFVVTILVFTAPLFICFALFNATKEITKSWMSLIIAYTLYPAVVFVFVGIFFMSMDRVYYGIDPAQIAGVTTLKDACTGGNQQGIQNDQTGVTQPSTSVFCEMFASVYNYQDTCSASGISNSWINPSGFSINKFFNISLPQLNNSAINSAALEYEMLKLMLIVFLFYLISGSVTTFIGHLFNISDLSSHAQSGFGALASFSQTSKKYAGAAKKGYDLYQKYKKAKQASKGDQGGGGRAGGGRAGGGAAGAGGGGAVGRV